jgi:hypothetical protein
MTEILVMLDTVSRFIVMHLSRIPNDQANRAETQMRETGAVTDLAFAARLFCLRYCRQRCFETPPSAGSLPQPAAIAEQLNSTGHYCPLLKLGT